MRRYAAFDQLIEVEFCAFPVVWWLFAGFEVRVGGQVFHPRLDRAGFFAHPITEFHVWNDGQLIPGMVRGVGHWFFVRNKRYSVVVGLSELARDTQSMRGWVPACLAALAVWTMVLLAVFGAMMAGWMLWHRFYLVGL